MKKIKILLMLLAFSFLSFSQNVDISVASGNSGFEDNFSGWSKFPISGETDYDLSINEIEENVNTGVNALYYASTTGYEEQQVLWAPIKNLVQGQTYALTFFTKGTEADVYVVKNKDEDTTNGVHYAISTTDGNYVFHTMLFEALNGNGNMTVKFYFKNHDGATGYPMYLDDVNVLPIVAGGNTGFEDGLTNWSRLYNWGYWPSDIEVSSANPYVGDSAVHYPGSDAFQQLISSVTGLRIGKTYTFFFQAAGTACDMYVGPVENVYAGTYYNVNAFEGNGDYVTQKFIFTATASTMLIWMDFYPNDGDGNIYSLYLDDFHVAQHLESGKLLINEVNLNPPDVAEAGYIELYNTTGLNFLLENIRLEAFKNDELTPYDSLRLSGVHETKEYITIAKNSAAYNSKYGKDADYEFPGLDLTSINGLILRHDTLGPLDQFNDVPNPRDTVPIATSLYLRKGLAYETSGANLISHWCELGAGQDGSPDSTNSASWITTNDTNWHEAANWTTTHEPCLCNDVIIPAGGNQPTISQSGAEARTINVETGGLLTVNPTGELSMLGGLRSVASENVLLMESDETNSSSLIVNERDTSRGMVEYKRYLRNDDWHLTSSPVVGESYDLDFFQANYIDHNPESTFYALLDYDAIINKWNDFPGPSVIDTFNSGQGYLMARVEEGTTGGVVSFVGELAADDVSYPILSDSTRWHAVGNPFTSAIKINRDSDVDSLNFIDINSTDVLDSSFLAIYYWDDTAGEAGDYIAVNHASDSAFYAPPGQGFFIKAKTGVKKVEFPKIIQSHKPGVSFNSNPSWAQQLIITANTESNFSSSTKIKFIEDMSNGLDIGYDAGKIKGNSELNLYTQLIENNGVDFEIQCLPILGLKELEIPIGIDLKEPGKITFSIDKKEFPDNLVPVLEDKVLDTKKAFSDPGDIYATVVNENGYGRFYLSFSSTTDVNTIESAQTNFKVWYSNNFIKVSGNYEPNAMALVYDVNGRLLKQQELSDLQLNLLETGFAKSGVYLVKITSNNSSEVHKVSIVK